MLVLCAGLVVTSLAHAEVLETRQQPVVSTWLGDLLGSEGQTARGTKFARFNRVPFAEAPVGSLRLRDPQAKKPWSGVLDATVEIPACPQVEYVSHIVKEAPKYLAGRMTRPINMPECRARRTASS